MIDWPEDLVADIAARRSVLFLGAGVSRNAQNEHGVHPKEWSQYLGHLASRITDAAQAAEVRQCIKDGDLLTACELARKYLTPSTFKTEMLQEFVGNAYRHAKIHDDLSRVDSRLVMTSNFDKLYENRANQLQHNTVIVKSYYDKDVADVFRRQDRVVIKVHGTIDVPDSTIFTRSQYAIARRDYGHFYQLLRGLFVTHTFVFLGASMRDPDMQLLLEDHAYRFEGARPHYMAMPWDPAKTGILRVLEETMNLKALVYDPANNHQELADSVAELVDKVERAREKLADTAGW
ncbi:SIR2 family protein [Bradyrhizobium sp. STM 3566]|uniref:SIR2 family protein n=1 Tax=Bradyrhizobium sp. STM 3566 TaxID=578928 RepID=UPI00388EB5E6